MSRRAHRLDRRASALALALAGCRAPRTAPAAMAPLVTTAALTTAGAVTAPELAPALVPAVVHPPGCDYEVRARGVAQSRVAPHAPFTGRDPRVRNLHLTFVGDPSRSVVVQWSTDEATRATEVDWGDGDGPLAQHATGFSFTYSGSPGRREHEVHLCGLAPGRRYSYRAGSVARWSRSYAFTTAPADGAGPVRLMVAGDARGHPEVFGAIARRALEERPDALLFTGDAVGDGDKQEQWDALFTAAEPLLASTPTLWVEGNHDGVGEVFFAQFALPDNGVPYRHERWYAATYGPLRLVVLDDNTVRKEELRGAERQFLAHELAAVDRGRTPWIIAAHHQPMHTRSSSHVDDRWIRDAWGPLYDRYRLDVDLAGHVHEYECSEPLRESAVTDEAHGTRYVNFGGAGAPLYSFRAREPWVHARERTHGFGMITATATRLRWEARRTDGSMIDTFERDRP